MRTNAVIAYLTSPTLALALAIAPTTAMAAPDAAAPADAPADAAPADAAPADPPPTEGDAPAEGTPAEGEPAEGEPAEGEPAEPPAEGEVMPEPPPEPEPEPEPEPVAEEPPAPEVTTPEFEDDGKPEEPMINGKPRTGKGMMIAGGAVLVAGIAATATFASITRGCSLDGPLQCKYENQDQFLIPMGGAILLTGTILLSVGVGYHFHYKKWERWEPGNDKKRRRRRAARGTVGPSLVKGGGGLGWSGKF